MTWLTVTLSIVGGLLTGTGGAAIVNAVAKRRVVHVEVADRLNEMALEAVEATKADHAETRKQLAETRNELAEARREASDVRREMAAVRHEAELLAQDLHRLRTAILDPRATVELLRTMVGGPGTENGTPPTGKRR